MEYRLYILLRPNPEGFS